MKLTLKNQLAKGGYMTHLAITLALLFVVFLSGYYLGMKRVVKDIRSLTKELEERANDADLLS